jgi:endonuclease/exonuclease/phosphatase (EEP) superfamily protein YafD
VRCMDTEPRKRFSSYRVSMTGLACAAGTVAGLATVLGFFGGGAWFLDLFSHFHVQYFTGLVAAGIVVALARKWKSAAVLALLALANFAVILPLYVARPERPPPDRRTVRAMLINVNTQAGNPKAVAEAIRRYDPDILVLEEVSAKWLDDLRTALERYPYYKAVPRDDNFGMSLYSKFAVTSNSIEYIGQPEVPSIFANVDSPAGQITVIATHPVPPSGARNAAWRDAQLAELPKHVRKTSLPVILLGDLNVTPWSAHFRRLLKESGLHDSAYGRGVHPTWPTISPLLWIPIDHCLHSSRVVVKDRVVGSGVGSDHYPLIVDFVLR